MEIAQSAFAVFYSLEKSMDCPFFEGMQFMISP